MGLLNTLRNKVELYRLEQRYTKRQRRTTFISGAQYVDGEYVYGTHAPAPASTQSAGSFQSSDSGNWGHGFNNKRSSKILVKEVLAGNRDKRRSGKW